MLLMEYSEFEEFIYLIVFIFVNKDLNVQRSRMMRELSWIIDPIAAHAPVPVKPRLN